MFPCSIQSPLDLAAAAGAPRRNVRPLRRAGARPLAGQPAGRGGRAAALLVRSLHRASARETALCGWSGHARDAHRAWRAPSALAGGVCCPARVRWRGGPGQPVRRPRLEAAAIRAAPSHRAQPLAAPPSEPAWYEAARADIGVLVAGAFAFGGLPGREGPGRPPHAGRWRAPRPTWPRAPTAARRSRRSHRDGRSCRRRRAAPERGAARPRPARPPVAARCPCAAGARPHGAAPDRPPGRAAGPAGRRDERRRGGAAQWRP